ncbi:MAG TPA: OmpH family outer membrane protein [Verrucomicrobiae bacterium]|nr:OmpH family outer membrane protein [Verrucomicrobiae bacterium]
MKKVFGIICCILFGTAAANAADGKIAYVDVQKALNQSVAGKEAKEQLAGRVKKYQDEINLKQEELKKLKDELEKQSVILSESKRGEKEKEYGQKLKDFQRFTKDAQEELQGKDEEFTRRILEEFEKVVKEYGKKKGYTFIFARNETMVYADEKADITEDLIKQFDAPRKK